MSARMLKDWSRRVATSGDGDRNNRLNDASFALGRCVGASAIDEGEVRTALMNAAEACGYVVSDGRSAALKTINSGLRAGRAKPETFDAIAADEANEAEADRIGGSIARNLMRAPGATLLTPRRARSSMRRPWTAC